MSLEILILKSASTRALPWTCYWYHLRLNAQSALTRPEYQKLLRSLAQAGYLKKQVIKFKHRTCLQNGKEFQRSGTYYQLNPKGKLLLKDLKEFRGES